MLETITARQLRAGDIVIGNTASPKILSVDYDPTIMVELIPHPASHAIRIEFEGIDAPSHLHPAAELRVRRAGHLVVVK